MKYLVMLRYAMDDLPLRMFDNEDDAVAYAEAFEVGDPDEVEAIKVLDIDASIYCNVSVYMFNATGTPVGWVVVKDLDDGASATT